MISSLTAVVLAALAYGVVFAAPATDQGDPWHVRVIFRDNATTEATVSWSTETSGESHQLAWRIRGSTDGGDGEWQKLPCQRSGEYGRAGGLWFHHARLTDLTPGEAYEVRAESDDKTSRTFWFRTAPTDGKPFQLLYGGDSRSRWDHRQRMNRLMQRLVAEAEKAGRPPVVALAHGGDFVQAGRKLHQWRQWLADHTLSTTDTGQLLPIIPTRGNHDYGPLFNQVFDFPDEHRNYYATRLTPTVTLLTLNTETSTVGDQLTWLTEQLQTPAPDRQWLFCQYHKPAFPAVKITSGAFASWVPLFEKHGVDFVLEADGHCIKRTPPILGMKVEPTGVVYLGEGGLGVGQRTPHTYRWYLKPPAVTGKGNHVHLLTFDGGTMTGRVIRDDASVFDEFTLTPRSEREAKANPPADE